MALTTTEFSANKRVFFHWFIFQLFFFTAHRELAHLFSLNFLSILGGLSFKILRYTARLLHAIIFSLISVPYRR